ncbi:anti-sigma factor family protein [Moorella sulfitireducens]|uniref:anti-sigma factor family protein n=1 Tax=Neomoorella sulfitireducens TaxID=2972948 RepID=UPI0021ABA9D1
MNCNNCREMLSSYIDGVLTTTERLAVEKHLRWCDSCRQELDALRRTVDLLKNWSEEEMELPAGFSEGLRSKLEAARRPWYRRLPQWLSLAAALMIVVAVTASAGYLPSPFQLRSRQDASMLFQEKTEQVRIMEAPAPMVMEGEPPAIYNDLENKGPVTEKTFSEERRQPVQPLKEQGVKTTGQAVLNSDARETIYQAGSGANSRGQGANPANGQDQQAGEGEQLPGQKPPEEAPGDNGHNVEGEFFITGEQAEEETTVSPSITPDNETDKKDQDTPDAGTLPAVNINSTELQQSLTVPEKVYEEPETTSLPPLP